MPALPSPRLTASLIVLIVVGLLGFALYSEIVLGLEPCPLCVTQRVFFLLLGLIALAAALHDPGRLGRRIYALLMLFAAGGGAAVAGRQVWLQHLPPDQVPACGPSLGYMLETFPLGETLRIMFTGDGNCAEVHWQFLGLSMPAWSLLWFVALAAVAVWHGLRRDAQAGPMISGG